MVLHTCCLAGPQGDDCRHTLAPNARLLTSFEAGSHFEAMTIYHRGLGREPYSTNEAWDYEPYPEDWLVEQQGGPGRASRST
jgi:hypothetical protein